jgi:uncharacterized protein YigA (DUF484 family)
MSHTRTSNLKREVLTDDAVEQYLRSHPDFFEHHGNLLETLKLPHARGEAVSLVERQAEVLRARNRHVERKLVDLMQVARDNEVLNTRLHRLALDLLGAEHLNDVIAITKESLRSAFAPAQVLMKLFKTPRTALLANVHVLAEDDLSTDLFENLHSGKRPMCGILSEERAQCLFESEAPDIASAVMIPLMDGSRLGILAVGYAEQDRFHVGMGTLFLHYLGELVSRAVVAHLDT